MKNNANDILEEMIVALDEIKKNNPDSHAPITLNFKLFGREFILMEVPKSIFLPEYQFRTNPKESK